MIFKYDDLLLRTGLYTPAALVAFHDSKIRPECARIILSVGT